MLMWEEPEDDPLLDCLQSRSDASDHAHLRIWKRGACSLHFVTICNNMENRTEDVARAAKLAAHDKRW